MTVTPSSDGGGSAAGRSQFRWLWLALCVVVALLIGFIAGTAEHADGTRVWASAKVGGAVFGGGLTILLFIWHAMTSRRP